MIPSLAELTIVMIMSMFERTRKVNSDGNPRCREDKTL